MALGINELAQLFSGGVGNPMGQTATGSVPFDPFSPQAIYGNLPYAAESPTTDALMAAMGQRGPYAGARGFMRGAGQPLGLPRADLLSEVGGGQYGAANQLGRTVTSGIPMGAGQGTGVGSLPYSPESFAMPAASGATSSGIPTSSLARGLRGVESGVSSELAGSVAGGRGAMASRGLMGTLRGMAPAAETGIMSRLGSSFRPGSVRGGLGRLGAGIAIGTLGGAAAEKAGGSNTLAGQALEGASMGGSFGAAAGAPGAIVGGLGVGLGNVLSHAILGRGIESITGGGESEATGPLADYLKSQVVGQDRKGNDVYSDRAQVMAGLMDPETNMFAQLGIPTEVSDKIQADYARDSKDATQEQRVELLGQAADKTIDYLSEAGGGNGTMSPSDLATMQIAASQLIAPVAADQVALGNMQADALSAIQPNLPEAYQQPVQNMINQAAPAASRASNAYIQQAVALPQLNVIAQQQAMTDQMAQQLTAQALSGASGGGGIGDLASLVSGAGQGGGGSSADIVAQMQQLGLQ